MMFITNYNLTENQPFLRISELSSEYYNKICTELVKKEYRAFQRFSNPDNYLKLRLSTEKWLYNEFLTIGGKPLIRHPYYFVLGESSYLEKCFGPDTYKLQLEINSNYSKDISFTLGDSISVFKTYRNITSQNVYDYKTINKWISKLEFDLKYLETILSQKHTYIEAQLWNPYLLQYCQYNQ